MSFFNQPSIIVQDGFGNLHNFAWGNQSIFYTSFEKQLGTVERRALVDNVTLEFDVATNNTNDMYLLCQKKDGSILLTSNIKGAWTTKKIIDANDHKILNLNIALIEDKIHIFYCLGSNESENIYRIYHHFEDGDDWTTNEVCVINTRQILNPIEILISNNNLILGYYNLIDDVEQIFIKTYDITNNVWKEEQQLTNSQNKKIYMDMLVTEKEDIIITYSEYIEGNLVVKNEKFNKIDGKFSKVSYSATSNPGNCSYPTLVIYNNKLWNVWTEYDYIASTYSDDMGDTWNSPYLWNESRGKDIVRYKFVKNKKNHRDDYLLNYSFGRAADLSFIGFGDLEKASQIPLKKKEEGEMVTMTSDRYRNVRKADTLNDCAYENDIKALKMDLKNIKNSLQDQVGTEKLQDKIDRIQGKLKDMTSIEDRIKDVEKQIREINEFEEKMHKLEVKTIEKLDKRIENIENFLEKKARGFKVPE